MINGNKYGEYHFDIVREGERKSKLTYEWSVGTDDEMQTLLVWLEYFPLNQDKWSDEPLWRDRKKILIY